MKWLCYMGILKEGFSAYPSPVMLISRKLTKDKRVVTVHLLGYYLCLYTYQIKLEMLKTK